MTQAEIIEAVLQAPPERLPEILNACRGADRPRPGTVKQAAEILGCHPRTVKRYGAAGLLCPIRLSPKTVRWDLNAVVKLAERGV